MDEMKNIDQELGFPGKSTFIEQEDDQQYTNIQHTNESSPIKERTSIDSSKPADLGLSGFKYISTEKIAEDLTCMNSQEIIGDPLADHLEGPQDTDPDLEAEIERINNREKIELRQQVEHLKRTLNDRDLAVRFI